MHVSFLEPPNKGYVGDNINSLVLSFVQRLSSSWRLIVNLLKLAIRKAIFWDFGHSFVPCIERSLYCVPFSEGLLSEVSLYLILCTCVCVWGGGKRGSNISLNAA